MDDLDFPTILAAIKSQGGGGGTVTDAVLYKSVMPEASSSNLGKIIVYTGATTSDYEANHIYKCVVENTTYSWDDITPESGQFIQYETMPTAASELDGDVVQFVGSSSADYTKGYFYECESTHLRAASAVVTRGTITNPTFDRHRLQTLGLQQGVYDFAVISSKWNIKQNGTYTEIEGGDDLTQIALLGITYTGTAGEGARILVAITGGTDAYEAAGSTITFNQATMDAAFNNTTGALLLTYVNDATYGLGWQPVHHDNLVPTSDPRLDPATLGANLVNTPNEGDYLAIHYKMNDPVYDWTQIDVQPAGSTINVVQTTGTSTTDVMSQNAVTALVGNVETLITTLVSGGGAQ